MIHIHYKIFTHYYFKIIFTKKILGFTIHMKEKRNIEVLLKQPKTKSYMLSHQGNELTYREKTSCVEFFYSTCLKKGPKTYLFFNCRI